jgi:hypothetical protein
MYMYYDLPISSLLYTLLFADDATLLQSHSDFDKIVQMINVELKKVVNFFRLHQLARQI